MEIMPRVFHARITMRFENESELLLYDVKHRSRDGLCLIKDYLALGAQTLMYCYDVNLP